MASRRNSPVPRQRPGNSAHRKGTQLPLDPSHLRQRPIENDRPAGVVQLKSPTRHPTVFRKRIAHADQRLSHGDLVQVVADGKTMGYGLWNPRAEATVRILAWGETPPDASWWDGRLKQAVGLRQDLLRLGSSTNAYRILNAEGDGLPGLVADRYRDVIAVQAFTLGMYQRSVEIAQRLAKLCGVPHWLVRTGPSTYEQEGFLGDGFDSGEVPEKVIIEEHSQLYEIHPRQGHKTGFFCDQRENRLRLRTFCAGRSVLDLCCYAGGFALNAAAAGASSVIGVDLDEEAIELARRNARLNKASIKFVHADAFGYMRDAQRNDRQFDVVILDPPKLIRQREEETDGRNKYFDLNQLAATLVAPGGILLSCSCSGLLSMSDFTLTVRAAAAERSPRLLLRSGAGPDHPVALNCLETEYLKCLWMQVGQTQ